MTFACPVLLAACGSATSAPPASTAASAPGSSASAKPAASAAAPASAKPAAAASASAGAGAQAGNKLIVVYPTVASLYLSLWMCTDGGVCGKNGLDVDARLVQNSASAMASLLSGEIQVYQGGGSDGLNAATSGADVVMLATMAPVYPYKLEVAADIKQPSDLKGKKLAIGSVGDTSEVATRLALQHFGLEAGKDVALVAVGGVPQRTAALQSGAVQGTVDSPPSNLNLEKLGFHPLVDIATLGAQSANQVVTVQRSWLNAHHDLAQRYIDSMIQSVVKAKQDKATSVALLKKYYKSDDDAAMTFAWEYATGEALSAEPYPKVEQFKDAIATLSSNNPKIANFDVAKLLDPSFVQNAVDRGLDKG